MAIVVSRSGRRYYGVTLEDAQRKYLLATLHAYTKEYPILREISADRYGTSSFGKLSLQQLWELKKVISESSRTSQNITNNLTAEPKLTEQQRKKIIRLGLYVIGKRYGSGWFWRKCREWIPRFRQTEKIDLDSLTNYEAWIIIRKLEKIEQRIHRMEKHNETL